MRAREPDVQRHVERDGVRIGYELYGEGERTILMMPTWTLLHSRIWKAQVPYLARHYRVVTFDPRGNGASDRPADATAYAEREFAADALAVLDATQTQSAILVALSLGALRSLIMAAECPDRVDGIVMIGPSVPLAPPHPERAIYSFDDLLIENDGWARFNRHYWQKDYRSFVEFFVGKIFSEPHSTKQIEDCTAWALETSHEQLIASAVADTPDPDETLALCGSVRCPVLVIHGDEDAVIPLERGRALAEATGGQLVAIEGAGHAPNARDPVKVNLLIRDFAEKVWPRIEGPSLSSHWPRASRRPRKVLFVSSPIGLGHAQRDVAIARELRRLVPDLQIDWLAQSPVTQVLEAEGERIHPASRYLASESRHIESESAEHDLHCFQAWRRMDEILVANFMLFHEVARNDVYDVWIGDEAWEVDYYLHENPELKRASYVWLTDFVGWLPMADGGEREAFLTADYNEEMIGQIARFPRVRDRALFVGNPDDVVTARFGPTLPPIREWTEQHYRFTGYVSGFDPAELGDRERLREELGYRPDETICIVTVGGTAVGADLLRRIAESFNAAKRRIPSLRMILVTGPRIDPSSLPQIGGVELRPYVHNLYRHLAASDIAIVQGGLTTSMELTASRRPFLYFPLRHHFEQNVHVRHRLSRYGAGRAMDYETATPDAIAEAIAQELEREIDYRPVETDGAARAASAIAELF